MSRCHSDKIMSAHGWHPRRSITSWLVQPRLLSRCHRCPVLSVSRTQVGPRVRSEKWPTRDIGRSNGPLTPPLVFLFRGDRQIALVATELKGPELACRHWTIGLA